MNPVCPCGSSRLFDACCGPILAGTPAPTAEALMRSRYTAFTLGNVAYLEATNSVKAAKGFDRAELEATLPDAEWLGLEIRATRDGGVSDATGMVRFAATYRYKGRQVVQVETSEFVRAGGTIDGRWLYDRGEMALDKPQPHRVVQIGRNDPCPCGSGSKYKKCCGK